MLSIGLRLKCEGKMVSHVKSHEHVSLMYVLIQCGSFISCDTSTGFFLLVRKFHWPTHGHPFHSNQTQSVASTTNAVPFEKCVVQRQL